MVLLQQIKVLLPYLLSTMHEALWPDVMHQS